MKGTQHHCCVIPVQLISICKIRKYMKSIEINAKRFNMSDELKQILINTVEILEK